MSAFGEAFKKARAAGKKIFEYNGKKYHTRTKEDEKKKLTPTKVTAKSKTKAKPKRNKADPGKTYAKMAKAGKVPGKSKAKAKPKNKTYSRRRNTTTLNRPRAR
jgi:hypothetical protein